MTYPKHLICPTDSTELEFVKTIARTNKALSIQYVYVKSETKIGLPFMFTPQTLADALRRGVFIELTKTETV